MEWDSESLCNQDRANGRVLRTMKLAKCVTRSRQGQSRVMPLTTLNASTPRLRIYSSEVTAFGLCARRVT